MNSTNNHFTLKIEKTEGKCPIGEQIGRQNNNEGKIPVMSCEGACIRGEIARLAANYVSKEDKYGRGCHGELFTVPNSAIAEWITKSEKVVMIDGCFLKCHERILKNIIEEKNIIHFDALSQYKKYTDVFDIDAVPEKERKQVARDVANWVLENLQSMN